MKVHPIQLDFNAMNGQVECGLCGAFSTPRYHDTEPRVTHLVHLVREHLDKVQYSLTKQGAKEEIKVD